jgi:ubiquitin-protein ligase/DNA-directed RNA polymerase subunit RPC12/RpoP
MTDPLRLQSDLERLQALATSSGGRIAVHSGPSAASPFAIVELRYATAGSDRYPLERREQTRISIALPARYPFQPPLATVQTPIWHPNVFTSGTICLGTRWSPTEGLDLFVQRLARLLTFDPLLVNIASAANREAAAWYERARRQHPHAFPSDRPAFEATSARRAGGRVRWQEAPADDGRVQYRCPDCARMLRLPSGRAGHVRCPGCGTRFEART